MQVQDWFNGTSLAVPEELTHLDEFGDHPQFVSWSYGKDYNVIYVTYSDDTEILYKYDTNNWKC